MVVKMSKERELKKVIKKAEQTIYVEHQKASGLKVGDKVKILRKAESHKNGWINSWIDVMDVMIGQTATISSIRSGGIGLKSGYSYPFFVLEKVEPKPKPNPFQFLDADATWVESINGARWVKQYKKLGYDSEYKYFEFTGRLYRQKIVR